MKIDRQCWRRVLDNVWLFEDSCNVYAVEGAGGMAIIDAGTGAWLDHLNELPSRPVALACTHYFRDHSAGARRAAQSGIAVYVPEYERAIFDDPLQHFRSRDTYIVYDNIWDFFAPVEAVPIAGVLQDYANIDLAGIAMQIVPLPGATPSQVGLYFTSSGGKRTIFCAETIHSPGRVARLAPLQYNYNDLEGALGCYLSAKILLEQHHPEVLLPSLGKPITGNVEHALKQLQSNLRRACAHRIGMIEQFDRIDGPPLKRVTDHVWQSRQSDSVNWFVVSDSGKVLAIDYGYRWPCGWPSTAKVERRRAMLHSLEGLRDQLGIARIDVVLVSHYHDDHVCGIPVLQRLYRTQCWAAESFADLLEHPEAHCFPCTWPIPIKVDRRLPVGQEIQWEEYLFRLAPMSGHTRFSCLIGFEADGKRFAHTGDQYAFTTDDQNSALVELQQLNHVYRNGAFLDSYSQSRQWILEWRPDVVLQGHVDAFFAGGMYFSKLAEWDRTYRELHDNTMALCNEEPHFGVDSWGGWIWPYRVHVRKPETAAVRVTVRNPLPAPATITVRLVGPDGWMGSYSTFEVNGRAEVACTLHITPHHYCRRQPFAAELMVNGVNFGQVAEALLTAGPAF